MNEQAGFKIDSQFFAMRKQMNFWKGHSPWPLSIVPLAPDPVSPLALSFQLQLETMDHFINTYNQASPVVRTCLSTVMHSAVYSGCIANISCISLASCTYVS